MVIFHNNTVFTVLFIKDYGPQTFEKCVLSACQSSTSEILALLFFIMLIVSGRI